MVKRTQRPSVKNMSYDAARFLIQSYDESNETYLRNLVRKHVPNAEDVLSCADRQNLLYHTRTIRGVARRVNNYNKEISEQNQGVLDKIDLLPQVVDSVEREALDERICLQLEGCNIPFGCSVSNAYIRAKSSNT